MNYESEQDYNDCMARQQYEEDMNNSNSDYAEHVRLVENEIDKIDETIHDLKIRIEQLRQERNDLVNSIK